VLSPCGVRCSLAREQRALLLCLLRHFLGSKSTTPLKLCLLTLGLQFNFPRHELTRLVGVTELLKDVCVPSLDVSAKLSLSCSIL
jgi:hypothetical protein